jgi:hypothetical protein
LDQEDQKNGNYLVMPSHKSLARSGQQQQQCEMHSKDKQQFAVCVKVLSLFHTLHRIRQTFAHSTDGAVVGGPLRVNLIICGGGSLLPGAGGRRGRISDLT